FGRSAGRLAAPLCDPTAGYIDSRPIGRQNRPPFHLPLAKHSLRMYRMNMFARRPDPLAILVATLLISSSSAHAAWEAVPELKMFVENTDNRIVNSKIKEIAPRNALE